MDFVRRGSCCDCTLHSRLHDHRDLLRGGARHRVCRPTVDQDRSRLLPVRPLAAGVDHRPGVHLREPGRARDPRPVGQRRPVRRLCRALLLDRRGAGDGVPRAGDDAVLLRGQGPLGARVPAPALRRCRAHLQRAHVRGRHRADRRRQPVRAGADHPPPARLAGRGLDPGRRGDRAHLHHARRPDLGDLQRGAPVLRDLRRPDTAHAGGAALGGRLVRARAPDQGPSRARERRTARLEGPRRPP